MKVLYHNFFKLVGSFLTKYLNSTHNPIRKSAYGYFVSY